MSYELGGNRLESITGAVELSIRGNPVVQSPEDLLEMGRRTEFVGESTREIRPGGKGRIAITPAAPSKRPLETALMEGLMLAQWEVEGELPDHIRLDPGTYFYAVQHLNRRWLGFAIGFGGGLACTTIGLIAKQRIAIHPDEPHPMVQINTHSMFGAEQLEQLSGKGTLRTAARQDWVDYSTWEEHGVGCITTTFCSPTT